MEKKMKTKIKKKEIFEKKKKENKKFLNYVKTNQKYENFQKAILNSKNQKLNNNIKKLHDTTIKNKDIPSNNIKVNDQVIEPNTFSKAYNFIFDKVINSQPANIPIDTHMLYCNFDLSVTYNIGKSYNFPINLTHSYYSDVIILVTENGDKWKNMVIENKLKKVKKVITYDKLEDVYYRNDLLNDIVKKYDLYIFDSSTKAKKYGNLISKIKKYNKTYTTVQINEDNFVDTINRAIRRTYTDLNRGSTHSVPIGYLTLGKDKLYDNIKESAKVMLQFYEQKKISVVSINLRYINMTIPVYIHALKDGTLSESY
ncbi:ribosomal protein L1, putative [Plasmodium yoelii]|nr:ribosomal protein L1, putative [Plasmodium yoelii]CDU19143.1 conserved Plasmodium protein, unknown function [Plasmodium yoelii]VTZ79728.1 ribosomal protein L1, putative [Plasmodium yoelii]|eukprot:XP_022812503.1 ribosomal protein L1, putative [Plasmodium yoelii]